VTGQFVKGKWCDDIHLAHFKEGSHVHFTRQFSSIFSAKEMALAYVDEKKGRSVDIFYGHFVENLGGGHGTF